MHITTIKKIFWIIIQKIRHWDIFLNDDKEERKWIEKKNQFVEEPLETDPIYKELNIGEIYIQFLFNAILRKTEVQRRIPRDYYKDVIVTLNNHYKELTRVSKISPANFETIITKLTERANAVIGILTMTPHKKA